MTDITVSDEFISRWPDVVLGCLQCDVEMQAREENLWKRISETCFSLQKKMKVEEISSHPAISSSRKAYRALGKDPARYRLSAEALMRRVVKEAGLYQVNNVVDIVNLVSLTTGYSIGGYDSDKIQFPVELSVGKAEDEYYGIGRGLLNIESLPVLKDSIGTFGNPTSDSERTSVTMETRNFLMVIFGFGHFNAILPALDFAHELLNEYARAGKVEIHIIKKKKDGSKRAIIDSIGSV